MRAHADTAGSADTNLKLSVNRAQVVLDELLSLDVTPSKVTVQAVGESQSPVPTGDGVPEPLNRLVTVDWD